MCPHQQTFVMGRVLPSCWGYREIESTRPILGERTAYDRFGKKGKNMENKQVTHCLVPPGEMKQGVQERERLLAWEVGIGLWGMAEAQILARKRRGPRPPSKFAFAVAFHSVFPRVIIRAFCLISRLSLLSISCIIVRIQSYGSLPTIRVFLAFL